MKKHHEEEVSSVEEETKHTVNEDTEPKEDEAETKETVTEESDEDTQKVEEPEQSAEADVPDMSRAVVGGVHHGKFRRVLGFFGRHKVWSSAASVVIVLLLLGAVPASRYKIAGLFLKQTVTVAVVDSQTNAPVTSADVTLAGVSVKTDNHGDAKLHVRVGSSKVTVTKPYYQTKTLTTVVPILKPKHDVSVSFVATGRQVPIVVTNKITGKPLENAEVKAADSEVKTDVKGQATVVLPPNKATVSATISASGYNDATATIQNTTQAVAANTFSLTPTGKLYFLSNLSGKIDVVKTNLDGTDRQTVLAGTGFENAQSTSLLASRDWKYLALESVRVSGATAQLNLIDTTNGDKLTSIDQGANVTFTPTGWDGDNFIYTVLRTNVSDWQPGNEAIKSYNAQTGKITVLDQTSASGTSQYNFIHNFFGTVYILDGKVVYTVGWAASTSFVTDGHQAVLSSVMPDGSSKKAIQTFTPVIQLGYVGLDTVPYEANGLYLSFYDGANYNFFTFEDGSVKANKTLNDQTFYSAQYSTYLLSPSGSQNFWSVSADGKNNLLIGDNNGDNGKQIETLSDYDVYGWYTDNYLLVSKNSSELYIMPVAGGTPLKISDYYKPAQNFYGYGKGYGGL